MIQILDNNNENNNILNAAYCYAIKSAPQLNHYDILYAPEFRSGYQEISSCIKRIASYAFVEGDLRKRVVFRPNSTLESIGFHSFFRCKLRSIRFPASLTVIEDEAFIRCELREV